MIPRRPSATGGAWRTFAAPGVLIAAAFWIITWGQLNAGEPAFMAAIGVAAVGYVWVCVRVATAGALSPRALLLCFALALAWRVPLLTLPEATAHDAVRYVWDARVVRAGLNPYQVRPDDVALQGLHSDVTRDVDAAWLSTIYPPMAQIYFLVVTAIDESVIAFRVAALVCDAAIMAVLWRILHTVGKPIGWALLYAWHPLVTLEAASGAHLDFAGVFALLLSQLALLRGHSAAAAVTWAAAVLVKPLPIVLAPLYWRRIRIRDGLLAAVFAGGITAVIAQGRLPVGSFGTFVDEFRFNGPFFAAISHMGFGRSVAVGAVVAGLAAATCARRKSEVSELAMWVWPMAIALVASPVIYPWYLAWLIPFAIGGLAIPIWTWSLSILAVYPAWHLHRLGGPLAVPPVSLLIEFAFPAAALLMLIGGRPFWIAAPTAHE